MKIERKDRILIFVALLVMVIAALHFSGLIGLPKYAFAYVPTSSMEPTIQAKSWCLVERVDVSTPLEIGDVVVYENPSVWGENHRIIHRIVSSDTYLYRTKGDANTAIDPGYITRGNILYKTIKIFN